MQARKNLVSSSLNFLLLPRWYLKSPRLQQSITKNRFSRFWKEQYMFTKNGFFRRCSKIFSFITECTERFPTIFTFCIYFIAYTLWLDFYKTFHTLPNPPLPTTKSRAKELRVILVSSYFSSFSGLFFEIRLLYVLGQSLGSLFSSRLGLTLFKPSRLMRLKQIQKYKKFPMRTFFSLSLDEEKSPRLFFLGRCVLGSGLISESLVVRISLLRLEVLRSRPNYTGLTAELLLSYELSSKRGESLLASRIFLIP